MFQKTNHSIKTTTFFVSRNLMTMESRILSSNNHAPFHWSQPTRSVASVLSLAEIDDNGLEGNVHTSRSKQVKANCVELCSKILVKLNNFAVGAPIRAPSIVPVLKSKTTVLSEI